MEEPPGFLFVCCQRGAEGVLKAELQRLDGDLRPAYSRPGFVTFKITRPDPAIPWTTGRPFDLPSVFARCSGYCLGKLEGSRAESLAESFWQLAGDQAAARLHVWQRDAAIPGERGFEPGITPLAQQVGELLLARRPPGLAGKAPSVNRAARSGQRVLDCVLVEPNEWWVGWHEALTVPSCWPGGIYPAGGKPQRVSRAYLKMNEALAWSRLPLNPGDACVEIGSSPGGSCQALLDRGLLVTGIDPAEMDPLVLEHPRFRHVRKRAADLKRREFRDVRWLFSDANVAPKHTLDTVEAIVTHREVHIRGLLLTLKFPDWQLAERLDEYLARVRDWGYRYVRARQLAFNRQEVCVVALRRRSLKRGKVLQRRHARAAGATRPSPASPERPVTDSE